MLCTGFPTIKLLYWSDGKIKSTAYEGQRTAKDMVAFALDKAKYAGFAVRGVVCSNQRATQIMTCVPFYAGL